jgi:hypothetical protein
VAHVVKNLSFVGSDAAGGEKSAVFRLGDEGADDGDKCRVCGDGWLKGPSSSLSPRKWWLPATLPALGRER